MKRLFLSVLAVAGMAMAAGKSYTVTLSSPVMLGTAELKPGEYEVRVDDQKATIKRGKMQTEATVKVETANDKFDTTTVRLGAGEKPQIQEIRLGGTKTRLVFGAAASASGM